MKNRAISRQPASRSWFPSPRWVAVQHEFVYDPASQLPLTVCIYRSVILTGLTSRKNVKQQKNTVCRYVISALIDFFGVFDNQGEESTRRWCYLWKWGIILESNEICYFLAGFYIIDFFRFSLQADYIIVYDVHRLI